CALPTELFPRKNRLSIIKGGVALSRLPLESLLLRQLRQRDPKVIHHRPKGQDRCHINEEIADDLSACSEQFIVIKQQNNCSHLRQCFYFSDERDRYAPAAAYLRHPFS